MASIQQHKKKWRVQVYVQGRRSSKVFRTEAMARSWADQQECRVAGMPALRAALQDHRLAVAISPRLMQAISTVNFPTPNSLKFIPDNVDG